MLGETGIDMRNEDLLPLLSTAQNVARITIGIEDPSGNLKGIEVHGKIEETCFSVLANRELQQFLPTKTYY